MPEETITLRADDGRTSPAIAEVIRYGDGARIGRAVLFLLGGLLAGTACVVVPGPHTLVSPVVLAVGVLLFFKALRTREKLLSVSGDCPGCGAAWVSAGGSLSEPRSCPGCKTAIALVWPGEGG